MSTVIGVIIIILAIIVMFSASGKTRKEKEILQTKGYNPNKRIEFNSFIGSHPDINEPINRGYLVSDGESLVVCNKDFKMFGKISKDAIKNVVFEDATTFGKRVSASRLLLLGVFALAWQKRTKNEQAYVTIEWNDGRFDHNSAFLFEGK